MRELTAEPKVFAVNNPYTVKGVCDLDNIIFVDEIKIRAPGHFGKCETTLYSKWMRSLEDICGPPSHDKSRFSNGGGQTDFVRELCQAANKSLAITESKEETKE